MSIANDVEKLELSFAKAAAHFRQAPPTPVTYADLVVLYEDMGNLANKLAYLARATKKK